MPDADFFPFWSLLGMAGLCLAECIVLMVVEFGSVEIEVCDLVDFRPFEVALPVPCFFELTEVSSYEAIGCSCSFWLRSPRS